MSVLFYLEQNGMATARRIQEGTGLTQATVSRQLRALKDIARLERLVNELQLD